MAYKDYRDPLYGFIRLNQQEQKIVDSRAFQRLRQIRQLGTTYLVYPTGNHTRFEHCLGTLEAATRLFESITGRPEARDVLGWTPRDTAYYRQLLRYAALLHDLGQPPFSHASESLLPGGRNHEDYTYAIITHPELGFEVLDEHLGPGTSEKVAGIAVGSAKGKNEAFLSELLTGDFGADRLDYLLRDSYHLGVSYGKFDVQRFLNTLRLRYNEEKKGPELAVEDGGLHTVEGLLLARYFMFLDVYFHKTRRILDLHLTEFLSELLPGGRYPEDVGEFLEWD
ncbi:MAG: HD domain-containing protein, partial [Firmicutes bacterium]|nr:HD domain-containing protein [Bacillota bacterium]